MESVRHQTRDEDSNPKRNRPPMCQATNDNKVSKGDGNYKVPRAGQSSRHGHYDRQPQQQSNNKGKEPEETRRRCRSIGCEEPERTRSRSRSRKRRYVERDARTGSRLTRKKSRQPSENDVETPEREVEKVKRCTDKTDKSQSRSSSPQATTGVLNQFVDMLSGMNTDASLMMSQSNILPEFDPMAKSQTISSWVGKVDECAEMYGWNERETIHYALSKLAGLARTWYHGLNTILYNWSEWKKKLTDSFPSEENYAELLTEMLAKRVYYGESLVLYYYEKMSLINRCSINGRKAIDCLIHGVDNRAVSIAAHAGRFTEPEDVLKYFQGVEELNRVREEDLVCQNCGIQDPPPL